MKTVGGRHALTHTHTQIFNVFFFSSFFFFVCFTFRNDKNKRRAQEVSEKLRDNRDLQHFLQNTQDVSSPSVYCSLFTLGDFNLYMNY